MLRRPQKVLDGGWNPSPSTLRSAGVPLPTDNGFSEYINWQYISVLLLLIINITLCSTYDAINHSEFHVVLFMYLCHHLRRFDDVVLSNVTKWCRFITDTGCIILYATLSTPSSSTYILWTVLLCAIWITVFMDDTTLKMDKRETFRNRTSMNVFDYVQKCFIEFIPMMVMHGFYTLPLSMYSRESYFTMRWFVTFIGAYYWTDELGKVVGDFCYVIRYMYVVLLLSLHMVYLLVEGAPNSYEFAISVATIISIAAGWVLSVVCLFMLNLFPHEIFAYFTK